MLAVVLPAAPAVADEGLSIGVAPALVEVQASAIGPAIYPLTAFNEGSVSCEVEVIVYDITLAPTGEVQIHEGEPGSESFSAAAWLDVSESFFTLEPGEELDVALTVTPPEDAEPGTHRALVDFRASRAGGPMAEDGVNVHANVGSLMLVTVPGEASADPVLELDVPVVCLTDPVARVDLCNEGSAHCFAEGAVAFGDTGEAAGSTVELDAPDRGALLLPAENRTFEAVWRDPPLVGRYTASAEIALTGGDTVAQERTFWVIRWWLIAAFAAAIAVLTALALLSRRYTIVQREQ